MASLYMASFETLLYYWRMLCQHSDDRIMKLINASHFYYCGKIFMPLTTYTATSNSIIITIIIIAVVRACHCFSYSKEY